MNFTTYPDVRVVVLVGGQSDVVLDDRYKSIFE